jgi:O-antigen/teichoic acid export membrane protein
MNSDSKVGRNTIYLLVSNFAGLCISLGFNVVLARSLGVDRFGEFAFAISFIGLFSVFVEFSLQMLVVRDVARNPSTAPAYLGNSLALKTVLFVLAFTCAALTASVLSYPLEVRLLLSILMLSVLFDGVRKCCDALFAATERMQYSAVLLTAEKALVATFGLIALYMHNSVLAIGLSYVAAHAVSQLASLVLLKRKVGVNPGRVEYEFCRELAQRALPFFAISLIAALYADIDKLFLFSMKDTMAVGFYAAVYRLVTLPTQFSSSFHQAIYPLLSKHAAVPERVRLVEIFRRSVRYLMFAAVPLAIGVTALAEPIIQMVYGTSYVPATMALQVLIWAYALEFFNPFFARVLFVMDCQRLVLIAVSSATGVNILLNCVLIPLYSFSGAAIATLISAAVIFVFLFVFVIRQFPPVSLGVSAAKVALAGVVMWIVLALLHGGPFLVVASAGGLVYVTCLLVTKAFSLKELNMLCRTVRGVGWTWAR